MKATRIASPTLGPHPLQSRLPSVSDKNNKRNMILLVFLVSLTLGQSGAAKGTKCRRRKACTRVCQCRGDVLVQANPPTLRSDALPGPLEQMFCCHAEHGVAPLRRDFSQRYKNECALVRSRMRDR